MKKLFAVLLSVVMTVSLFAGVAFASTAPTVTFNPANNTSVLYNANLVIQFDQAVRRVGESAALSNTTFQIYRLEMITLMNGTTPIPFAATYDPNNHRITVVPDLNLTLTTPYVLSVVANQFASNVAPHTVVPTASTSFTAVQSLVPTTTFVPANNLYVVDRLATPTITFNVPVRSIATNLPVTAAEVANFVVLYETLPAATPTLRNDLIVAMGAANNRITLTPASPLVRNARYTLHLLAGLETFNDVAISANQVTFTVKERDWSIAATVTGTVALNNTVRVSGNVFALGAATFPQGAQGARIRVEHLAVGVTTWPAAGAIINLPAEGTFSIFVPLNLAGSYRLALIDESGTRISQDGALLTHTIGTVAALPLVVTPSITSAMWAHDNTMSVELIFTQVDGGVLPPVSAVVTATFAGATAPVTRVGSIYTFTNPVPAVLSGPLVITVRDTANTMQGTTTINMLPRAAFNALVAPSAFSVGTPATISVTPFDALGVGPAATGGTFAYAVASVTGPFEAPKDVVILPAAPVAVGTFAPVTPRHGGTVTVTTRFYSEGHSLLFTEVDTFTVAGVRVELPVTVHRTGVATLRAIVTDAAGNRINNARVIFGTTLGNNMFSTRNPDGTFATATSNSVEVIGLRATQPNGSAVVNGEYSIDVTLRTIGDIRVQVEIPTLLPTGLDWLTNQANWPAAISVRGPLTYAVTLSHTLLAGAADEPVRVTVLNAGVAVTSGLTFSAPLEPKGMTVGVGAHIGGGVWLVPIRTEVAGTYTITVANAARTLLGETTITAVAPVVTVTPPSGKLTSNFNDIITVTVTDPRTNVPVAMPVRVAIDSPLAPNLLGVATVVQNAAPQVRVTPATETPWSGATYTFGSSVIANVAGHQFRINARPAAAATRTIDGVVQAPRIMVSVGQAGAVEPAVVVPLELTAATVEVMPHAFAFGRRTDITIRVLDAHGNAMVDRALDITGAVTAEDLIVPAAGIGLRITPTRLGAGGVINPAEVRFSVTNDRTSAVIAETQLVHRISVAPEVADTAAPVITTNAPATTTAATLPVTVTVTDDVSVTGIIFEGVTVNFFTAPTQTFVRTLTLAVGANTFVVLAQDAAGNVGTHSIEITRTAPPAPPADTAAPVIEVTVPAVTTEATAVVTVTVRDNVNLAANGIIFDGAVVPGFVARESVFTRTVTLREGMNIFSVSAQDVAGNVATRVIAVERRTPPAPVSHVITIGRANPAIGLDVPANVRNGRLMVPFRWFGERILEATVDYRVVGAAEIVTLVKGNITVELTLNSTIATVNGTPVSLDVAAFATGGRTLVPARFLAETFGYNVIWNPADDSVTITKR